VPEKLKNKTQTKQTKKTAPWPASPADVICRTREDLRMPPHAAVNGHARRELLAGADRATVSGIRGFREKPEN
jgi:hypothetical protein